MKIEEIPASERLKPLLDGLKLEMEMLHAEEQRRWTNIESYIKELNIAISLL